MSSAKMTIIITADEKGCKLSAPMDTRLDRAAVLELLDVAKDIVKNFKGGGMIIANDILFSPLANDKVNLQANKKF
jgi:hypothetical protein